MNKSRGISKLEKKWVYGSRLELGDRVFIVEADCGFSLELSELCIQGAIEVIPETVGQWTGKKEIYAGDILLSKSNKLKLEVFWNEQDASFDVRADGIENDLLTDWNLDNFEVLNSIHDKELL